MKRRTLLCLTLALPAACGGDAEAGRVLRDAPPAAAVVTPGMEREDLRKQLRALESELERALAGEPGRLLPAEAITDRLIHAERSVDWLATGYDLEARLRQLQAMADRVVARLRRGAALSSVEEDVAAMRDAVRDLERQLALPGGGAAPPTLDSLLAQDPMRDAESESAQEVVAARDSAEAERPPLPDIEPQVRTGRPSPLGTPAAPPDTIP
ncbi:MAG: hypothetical protein ACOCVZ_01350 [Gemmatimonadota bacterium]